MIVWHSEPACNKNFFDKAQVAYTVGELFRSNAVRCVLCGGPLTVNGCYTRHYRDATGNRHYGWVAQGHCANCHKYPSILPEFLMAHKHYEASVIEGVIQRAEDNEVEDTCAADISTMRHWILQFNARAIIAVGWLAQILYTVLERRISVIELYRKSLSQQLARLLKEYPAFKNSGIISNVNILLTMYNCGYL